MATEAPKAAVLRRYAKYIFLDVVKFSKRSAEAQSEIVSQINLIVGGALEGHEVIEENCILIPTGDGMCIALISPHLPYDVHMQVALRVLELLDAYNKATEDISRQFQVRIGINQNTDILVNDINDRRNIAGAGINMASRIMDKADENQILISQTVYDELQPSEQYMDRFSPFHARGKHGLQFPVFQYIGEGHIGLNCATPAEFERKQTPESRITKEAAYYFASAIKHRQFIVKEHRPGQSVYSLSIMLWFLAKDSVGEAEATDIAPYKPKIYGEGKESLDDVFKYYQSLDFRVISTLATFIKSNLTGYTDCLDVGGIGYIPLFVNAKGREKLKKEWPDIWKEFELDKFV